MTAPRQVHPSFRRAPTGRVRASRARRALAVGVACATAMLALVGLGASPAVAGGPTSVLIVNYDGSRASGALTGSKAYDDLVLAVDAMSDPVGESRPAEGFMSYQLRLTWMIHDVMPWRVDAVTINGSDVWVSTSVSHDGSNNLFTAPAVWHRPKDANLLVETLTSLGVIGDKPATVSPPSDSAARAPAAPAPTSATSPQSAGTNGSPWWFTVTVGAAALGIGLLLGRSGRRGPASVEAGTAPAPSGGLPPAGMPESALGASGAGGPGQRDDPSRPSPVGFTPDEAARGR